MATDPRIGIVVIGRNEGSRLGDALRAIGRAEAALLYVDSGSSDSSLELARSLGTKTIEIEPPYSAAKARNEGFANLTANMPGIAYVQFVDGDCELEAGWLQVGHEALNDDSDLAVVCGTLREHDPEASVYNRLCSLEWDHPVGEIDACGGIAMMRVTAFQKMEGFNTDLVAGEEPELCLRFRRAGWKIQRLPDAMATHDAAMTRFSQWWKRSLRSGYALAASAALHGRGPERYRIRETRSNWAWGCLLPMASLIPLPWTQGWSLLLLTLYPALFYRIYLSVHEKGMNSKDARIYAQYCVLGKLPEALGQSLFILNRLRKRTVASFDCKLQT